MSALQWELLTSMILDTLESVPNHVDGLVMTCPTHPGTPEHRGLGPEKTRDKALRPELSRGTPPPPGGDGLTQVETKQNRLRRAKNMFCLF